jgi:hypothetical protein
MTKTTKSETFFVWRAQRGFPLAVVTPNAAASRMWLELAIEESDPFHACNAVQAFQAIATRVAS